jgi:hypothetical protein
MQNMLRYCLKAGQPSAGIGKVGGCISIALCHFFFIKYTQAAMSPPVSLTKSAFFRFLTGKIA